MGLHREQTAEIIVEAYDLPITPDEYVELALEQIEILMSECHLMPGKILLITPFLFLNFRYRKDIPKYNCWSFEKL